MNGISCMDWYLIVKIHGTARPKKVGFVGPYKAILIGTVPCTFQLMYIKSSEDLL